MAQSSDLDQAFKGMTVQEVSISPTLKKISTDHIFGKITCDRSYPSTSSSSPKFLLGVNEDIVVANDWDQYVSTHSHSNSPTSNWEIEHLSPPSERVLVVMDYPFLRTFFHHHRSLTMSRYYSAYILESPHLGLTPFSLLPFVHLSKNGQ
ncbi:hypothetical protein RHMOL_Rhmol13G0299000 [Rhododendron molle]|uniref:Uncharacterized protein n=1 Tax=Rhododendron molle TaxID=49168 RepID=A0ACC0LCM4_RHOML|nr:hypothetical protein RHMOL_Rhmol13G0299000 [Rhododendron molle]